MADRMTEREFGILWQDLLPRVRIVARKHAQQIAGLTADDLEQEIAIRMWRVCTQSEQKIENLPSYLSRVAATAAIDVVRRSRQQLREQVASQDESVPSLEEWTHVDDVSLDQARLEQIVAELELLPKPRRTAVSLKLRGFTVKEVASLTGWTPDKSRNLMTRGMAQLRALLKQKKL